MNHPLQPAWAKAAIVAELEENTSDLQSDYFGSKTVRTVIIGWSAHTKDLFSEMRKAAALFPETAHLGPGKDRHTPRVVCKTDIKAGSTGRAYWKGSSSCWHSDLYGDTEAPMFETLAEAEAFIAEKGEPESISFDGEVAEFEWKISTESVEHREKYSMGHGYYLGYSRYSGWQVHKTSFTYSSTDNVEIAPHLIDPPPTGGPADTPAPKAPEASTGISMTLNKERNGVELRFPRKPSEAVRDSLKANGWRWSRFSSCWYNRDTPSARAFAASMAGAGTESIPEGTKNVPPPAAESCQFHFPKRCPSGCPYTGDRFSERQIAAQREAEGQTTAVTFRIEDPLTGSKVSHISIGGKDYFRNKAGRCEDAPCCGCCTI